MRVGLLAVAILGLGPLVAGCSDRDHTDGEVVVATTVAPITSIVANIGGERVAITGIVPEGTNSHTLEPRPGDARILSEADVIFLNALVLEEPTRELALEVKQDDTAVVELGTMALPREEYLYDFSFPEEEGKPNPHLWTDPSFARRYAEIVRDTLIEIDPDGAGYYAENYDGYAAEIEALDAAMRESLDTVAPKNRRLLTYHDAYAYFARSHGWEVVGAIQVSDFEDPTAAEVADLIDQVRELELPAVFGSEVFPSPVLDQIAAESGAVYYDDLRDDDLPGAPGNPEHNLLFLLRFNYATIVEALGGDAAAVEAYLPVDVVPDRASYPQ